MFQTMTEAIGSQFFRECQTDMCMKWLNCVCVYCIYIFVFVYKWVFEFISVFLSVCAST